MALNACEQQAAYRRMLDTQHRHLLHTVRQAFGLLSDRLPLASPSASPHSCSELVATLSDPLVSLSQVAPEQLDALRMSENARLCFGCELLMPSYYGFCPICGSEVSNS